MTEADQITALVSDLQKVIDKYRAEFTLPAASVIGALEYVKLDIFQKHNIP